MMQSANLLHKCGLGDSDMSSTVHMIKLLTGWLEMRDAWRSSAKVDCFLRSELETNFVVEEPCCDPEVAEAVV